MIGDLGWSSGKLTCELFHQRGGGRASCGHGGLLGQAVLLG